MRTGGKMAKGSASRLVAPFSDIYIENVFAVWEMNNKPSLTRLLDLIDADENGRKPEPITLSAWKAKYNWEGRSLSIQTEVQQRTDRELVQIRMDMMKRHAQRAKEVNDMAFKYLDETGFDSSASAVTALFKAFEEEKKSTGMELALFEVFTLSDEDLSKKMNSLLSRARDVSIEGEEIINGETEEVDALSNQQTSDE